MNKALRIFTLAILPLALLSGCNDSSKDRSGPSGGPDGNTGDEGPQGSHAIQLYGKQSSQPFHFQIIDSDGGWVDVDADGHGSTGNINVRGISKNEQPYLRVSVTGNQPAAIQLASLGNQNVDLLKGADHQGILQFDLRVHDKVGANNPINFKYRSEHSSRSQQEAVIDLTAVVNAHAGSGYQQIRIPTDCFAEQGVDFSQTLMPFILETQANMSFDIGNISLRSNAKDQPGQLDCNLHGEVITDLNSEVYRRYKNGNWVQRGWGRNFSFTEPASAHFPEEGGIGARYERDAPGETGGLVLSINDNDSVKDISRFIETGVLSFSLRITNIASHSGNMEVRMGSGADSESRIFIIENLLENSDNNITIPLRKLFGFENGSLDINTLKSIDRPLIIQPTAIAPNDSLKGFEFVVNDVFLNMIPAPGGCIPQ